MRRVLTHSVFVLGLLGTSIIVACSDDTATVAPGGGTSSGATSSSGDAGNGGTLEGAQAVVDAYAEEVHSTYEDSLDEAKNLETAIKTFTETPSKANLDAAKAAWVKARTPYGPTEAYRFYAGPIDNEEDGPEGQINAWPLDEAFIDELIDDADFTITKAAIAEQFGANDNEANVTTGYHAIEYLLWGADTDNPSEKTAGKREFTDYTTAPNFDRRKAYLLAVAELLVEDLQKMVDAWAPNEDNYRKTFTADPKKALENVLQGIGSLASGELAGERMSVAYKLKSQEDEHSCFSDTTNADLLGNFKGIKNVYLLVSPLVAKADKELDDKTKSDLDEAEKNFETMMQEPFDYAINQPDDDPARKAVREAIEHMKTIADDIAAAGNALGLTFEIEKSDNTL